MTVPIFRHRTETKFFYGHVVIAAGFLTWLIGFGTNATFSVFLTPVTMEFGWTRAEISIAYSLALSVQACLGIIMGWLTDKIGPNEINLLESPGHARNFLNCVRSRKETIAPCETAHRSASIGHLGQIAMLTGRKIYFNPETEEIKDDTVASKLLGRPMRSPYHL